MARYFVDHKDGDITEIKLSDLAPLGPWSLAACEMRAVLALEDGDWAQTDEGQVWRCDDGSIVAGMTVVKSAHGLGTTYQISYDD